MATERIETLVIGGGQAGLVMSHMLRLRGRPHLVVERHRVVERWRSERWDGLCFQFPNWSVRLPDFPFPHTDPDGFASTTEIVDYLDAYARFVTPPIRCGVEVTRLRLETSGDGFVADTSDGTITATNVVVATGPYQRAMVPPMLGDRTDIFQVHGSRYTNPDQLPPGAVLIVGSGASGAQIAEELVREGRRVYLSVSRHRRLPRRYRGKDLIWWVGALGLDQTPAERRGAASILPLITGAYGGHTIDFRSFAQQGMTLLGRATAVRNGAVEFAADLSHSVAEGDAAYMAFLDTVDAHIESHGLDMPEEPTARLLPMDPPGLADPPIRLDLRAHGISAVIWATGYAYDYGWLDVPVLDAVGAPVHRGGITDVPGLYFLGLQWLSKMSSSFLSGVGDDAARLADHIADLSARAS